MVLIRCRKVSGGLDCQVFHCVMRMCDEDLLINVSSPFHIYLPCSGNQAAGLCVCVCVYCTNLCDGIVVSFQLHL